MFRTQRVRHAMHVDIVKKINVQCRIVRYLQPFAVFVLSPIYMYMCTQQTRFGLHTFITYTCIHVHTHSLLLAVIVTFPLDEDPTVSVIAWTTTPWTLPSNLALCVHPDFTYVKVQGTAIMCITSGVCRRCSLIASYPGLPMFFNVYAREKKWGRPGRSGDVIGHGLRTRLHISAHSSMQLYYSHVAKP